MRRRFLFPLYRKTVLHLLSGEQIVVFELWLARRARGLWLYCCCCCCCCCCSSEFLVVLKLPALPYFPHLPTLPPTPSGCLLCHRFWKPNGQLLYAAARQLGQTLACCGTCWIPGLRPVSADWGRHFQHWGDGCTGGTARSWWRWRWSHLKVQTEQSRQQHSHFKMAGVVDLRIEAEIFRNQRSKTLVVKQ